MAWNPLKPENDMLLINFPAACRANWDAIALATDSALLITNAKVSASAAIADTKLAQIVTASKVSGAAITSLASVPSGAGVIPLVNIPTIPGSKIDTLGTLGAGAGTIPLTSLDNAVKISTNQTVAGIKTFTSIPVLPASSPTTDNQAARKKYIDDLIAAIPPPSTDWDLIAVADTQVEHDSTSFAEVKDITGLSVPASSSLKIQFVVAKVSGGSPVAMNGDVGLNDATPAFVDSEWIPSANAAGSGLVEIIVGPRSASYPYPGKIEVNSYDGTLSINSRATAKSALPSGTITSIQVRTKAVGGNRNVSVIYMKVWEIKGA